MLAVAVLATALGVIVPRPAAAAASTAVSSNWAGYAVSARSVRYRRASASWTVPAGGCTNGERSDSATWVGLGGLRSDSQGLEQTGTAFACTSSGQAVYSAWYELVPAASHTLKMTIDPGDRIAASVTVTGKRVRISLRDLTRNSATTFVRSMSSPDVSSADWIVEAPSICTSTNRCVTEQLSNFGNVQFARASATTVRGHRGTISDSHWSATKIELDSAGNSRFGEPVSPSGGALPSSLSSFGSAFSVSYQQSTPTGTPPTTFPAGPGPP